ncbi:MAG: hypothetical protein EOS76_01265 [Mesorhizobium sp.]|uniref:hypothetical protein n=1 Tax=unclassified Mesorhizobium TaxID=325217 RepID=UPI000F764A0A|nr:MULTISPECIES: hypothetical protein [unclassified Mesorhizobium]RVC81954.1 hypothetical protein EN766_02130 [Mesorhizobium sp. M2A.F.Ca.ET.046.02.1.1]AZO34225.1 hypothetical protein EJ072_06920 [Mesorhizobium sp. M2A.F.Ca.ET.046.03.2.1]AZO71657.1 hypothetical protein EJ067_11295 [Mesorhizobium sp. M1D.F.Ca.ET.043.01.1.1]RWB49765.1 MAG: hypothetical protein EOQ44_01175 [Mesorhizobium sp.]RWE22461.1 MAG: hypothetical protein EOS76_01265 [Mesorhizobium sp.]
MLPIWIQYLQALLTPTIALTVGFIAYRQWRTAHSKLVLELFERRLAVYELARKAVSFVNTHGRTSREAEIDLLTAMNSAEFLFGKDVRDYLDKMWERFIKFGAASAMMQETEGEERKAHIDDHLRLVQEITQFYYEGSDVFAPYMRMEHRLRPPLKKLRRRPHPPASHA